MSLVAQRRPTFTGGEPPTIIGAGELNYRVRHGNGCDLSAIVTEHIKVLSTFQNWITGLIGHHVLEKRRLALVKPSID